MKAIAFGSSIRKHTSWLNQVEIWFRVLVRKLLKRASFSSAEDLRQRILNFIDYFDETMAKPFIWTYTGRPLIVYTAGGFTPRCTSWFSDTVVMSWCELARSEKRLAPEIRRALYVDVLTEGYATN